MKMQQKYRARTRAKGLPQVQSAKRCRRAGVVLVIALIFLAILGCLSAAYASFSGMNLVQADNYRSAGDARLAAESGLEFLLLQIQQSSVAAGSTGQLLLDRLAASLQTNLNPTANLKGATVTYDSTAIRIPTITLPDGRRTFNATLTLAAADTVHVQVRGYDGSLSRAIGLDIKSASGHSMVFDFGIATRSRIELTGNASVKGKNSADEAKILSATSSIDAFNLTGNIVLQGDIYTSNPSAQVGATGNVFIGGVSSNNQNFKDHIHIGQGTSDFPEVDPSVFEPFATTVIDKNTSTSGNKTFTNIRIKAGTNPTFSGNTTLQGVIFIEYPNKVTFSGNLNLTGVVVTQDAGDNNYTNNSINFTGNTTVKGVEQLPNAAPFQTLRTMPGAFILAPGFGVSFTGNFGTVSGCMAADSFTFTGNAGGTVRGGIINYSDSKFTMTGNSSITVDRSNTPTTPPGFKTPVKMAADPDTYVEYSQ